MDSSGLAATPGAGRAVGMLALPAVVVGHAVYNALVLLT